MTLIIITIGASIMMRGIAAVVFDKNFHAFASPLGDAPLKIGGAAILPQSLLVFAGVAVLVAALSVFLKRTLTGKSMLATADNPLAARLVGIDTSRMIEISFVVSAIIGAIGGILATPIALTSYSAGTVSGAERICRGYAGRDGKPARRGRRRAAARVSSSNSAPAICLRNTRTRFAVIVLLLVLFIRPSGLFGKPGTRACVMPHRLFANSYWLIGGLRL